MWILAVSLIWLYFWVSGNWFARVVTFLGLVPLMWAISQAGKAQDLGTMVVIAAGGVVIAWLISGLPVYVRNIMARRAVDTAMGSGSGRGLSFY